MTMDAGQVTDRESAADFVAEAGFDNIKLAVTDLDGVLRGKYVSRKKFLSALDKGFGFCDVIFGWDSADELYAEDSFTGWKSAFPDAWARVDPASCRRLPLEDGQSALFLADFTDHAAASVCPRALLKRVLEQGEALGFSAHAAAEFEFFLFNETPDSLRDKAFRNPQPLTPGNFGYSILRNSTHADFYHRLLDVASRMGMPLEGLHTETGPGVLEAALEHCDALRAADNAVLFKTFTKVLAQQQGLMATFMARWSKSYPGQSGHLHMSLRNRHGEPVFHDDSKGAGISDTMRWFIGGQQKLLPELLCMVAGTCNSYTRLVPGFWAPTAASWGIDNRTCAIRAIPGTAQSQRVEYRIAAADINPYLALAAGLGSGFWGIQHRIEPSEPFAGDAYSGKFPRSQQLPASLGEAAARLRKSAEAKALFGEAFVDHYAYTREWEEAEQRKAVTDWQLQRYFEII
jgi:glutamine synthetase